MALKSRVGRGLSFPWLLVMVFVLVGIPSLFLSAMPEPDRSGTVRTLGTEGTYEMASPVMDGAGILSSAEKHQIENFLLNLNNTKGVQIAVLSVKSLGGESIESFSLRHAEKFKLGQKGIDNGALLTIALAEHEMRIETGYGTEGALTDALCARIIRNILVPSFRKGEYGQGIYSAVQAMASVITNDESLVDENARKYWSRNEQVTDSRREERGSSLVSLVILIFVLWVFIGARRRSIFFWPFFFGWPHHHHYGGHYYHNYHHDHFDGGGFGGGFGGGGGSFGGGGASGRW
ncbi:MAG: TPM domain-containing protein [Treponema sp.]|nr:TPM domain-containing protein [Treponema sp.]